MSRKIILSLATAVTVAVATLASQSADARGSGAFGRGEGGSGGNGQSYGGHFASFNGHGGRTLTPILPGGGPNGPGHPILPPIVFHGHHHHWVFRDGRWIFIDEVVDAAAPAIIDAPGPCTCLTKIYTPTGLVVFADMCTKESASAAVDGSADATQAPTTPVAATAVPTSAVPTNPDYAGRTYEDYLKVNPQAANPPAPQTQKN